MANQHLRQALLNAGITADQLAEIIPVDIRTVRRWLAGGTPYPRQRHKVARALDTPEHQLWPTILSAPAPAAHPSDLIAAYPTTTALGVPDWKTLMRESTQRIWLLADIVEPILGTAGVPQLLIAKAGHGCQIRLLLSHPNHHLVPLLATAAIEIHILDEPPGYTIHRYDQELLLAIYLLEEGDEQSPLLHLRRVAPIGLHDRLSNHYQHLWEHASQPIDPDRDIPDEHQDQPEQQPAPGELTAATTSDPSLSPTIANSDPSTRPRRWPRRPPQPD